MLYENLEDKINDIEDFGDVRGVLNELLRSLKEGNL